METGAPLNVTDRPLRLALYRLLLRVRPAPLACCLKRLLKIRRRIVETAVGRLALDPVSDFGFRVLTSRTYEPPMTMAFQVLLKPDDACVDLGANEGWFSLLAAHLTGPGGSIVAVEPQNRLHPVLTTNFTLNGMTHIRLDSSAVSDRAGEDTLLLSPDTNTGASGFSSLCCYRLPRQKVRTCTLHQLLDRHGLDRIKLLKMDIEGHEHEAILGSPEVFSSGRIDHLALELHPRHLHRRGRHHGAVTAFLSEAGYAPDPRFPDLVFSRISS